MSFRFNVVFISEILFILPREIYSLRMIPRLTAVVHPSDEPYVQYRSPTRTSPTPLFEHYTDLLALSPERRVHHEHHKYMSPARTPGAAEAYLSPTRNTDFGSHFDSDEFGDLNDAYLEDCLERGLDQIEARARRRRRGSPV